MVTKSVPKAPRLAARILLQNTQRDKGESLDKDIFTDTPLRFEKAWREYTKGYLYKFDDLTTFPSNGSGPVWVRNIGFNSLCEHHLAPFWGTCTICYHPGENMFGLSKFSRIVDAFARRLQTQEYMTEQIAHKIQELISPQFVLVQCHGRHMCMESRGINKRGQVTTTFSARSNGSKIPPAILASMINEKPPGDL